MVKSVSTLLATINNDARLIEVLLVHDFCNSLLCNLATSVSQAQLAIRYALLSVSSTKTTRVYIQ